MKNNALLISIIFTCMFLYGCQNEVYDQPEEKLTIYTSVYPIQYIVERIGGHSLNTYSTFPPGVDAHSYEPTIRTMTSLAKSDAFIYMGGGMEGFSETISNALRNENVKLIELGRHEVLYETVHHHKHEEELTQEKNHDGHHHGEHDPHIWIDPIRMIEMAHLVLEVLIELNPNQAALYSENFYLLKNDLIELDMQYMEMIKKKSDPKILVSHAAFGYWEERYGIQQFAINGISSTVEPSQKDLVQIIKQAEESNFNFVIFEQNTSSKVSTIIQDYINADSLTIHNLAVLTEEDLNRNDDYLTLMRKNLHILDLATK